MKKLLALLLVLVMVFSVATVFAGCEDDSKKSSNSDEKEDEEDEKEDDETTDPEGKDPTNPEGKDPTNPEGKDPTDPQPTDPEPTDPEPTETEPAGELMDAPDITFDTSIQNLAMLCTVYQGGEEASVEVDVQYLNDDEILICYCLYNQDVDVMMYINSAGEVKLYRAAEEGYVLDEEATQDEILEYYYAAASVSAMFTDPVESFGEGYKYQNLGQDESEDFGTVVAYAVYNAAGDVEYGIYVQAETGIVVAIADANGDPVAAINYMTQDFDLSAMIVG